MLRFDGLYASTDVEVDSEGDKVGECAYRYYLRFYEDGSVISASVLDPAKPQQIFAWFNKECLHCPQGTYTQEGSHLKLATYVHNIPPHISDESSIISANYEGTVSPEALALRFFRHATGQMENRTYIFLPVDESALDIQILEDYPKAED